MNLTVKTLKGGKFTIEVEASNTVAEVKTAVVSFYTITYLFIVSSGCLCANWYYGTLYIK